MSKKIRFLNPGRTLYIVYESELLLQMLEAFHYVIADNGVYVPKCDLSQYEVGNRPVLQTINKTEG